MQQSILGGSVSFSVVVHGKDVREILHNGSTFIEGRLGSQFSLRISNNSPERVLAVITVDGLSIMNGKEGSFNSGGYVIRPWSTTDIPGWRLDSDRVAKFFFSTIDQSYAAQMDKPTNVGVIGCAIFNEPSRPVFRPLFLKSSRGDNTKFSFGATMHEAQELGTGFGEEVDHHVVNTEFNRLPEPSAVLRLFYDTREKLITKGVPVDRPQVAVVQSAFPAEPQFCQPPRGWHGRSGY